jgi:hypothetical protein
MASKWNHHLLAAALLAVAGSAAGGCNLVLGIHELPDTGSGGAEACKSDLQCDSHGGCATSVCKDGVCETTPLPDGKAPPSAQIPFDCKVFTCVGGVVEQQNDDQDIPDDGEQCTVDSCNGGNAFHTAKPHTAGCSMGASNGLCSDGVCEILCVSDTACDDKNPCTKDACDPANSICTFTPLDSNDVPGMPQIDGDCQRTVCLAGVVTQSNDDTDLPKTATDCDDELCAAGMKSNPPLADTVSCGPNKDRICDGAGACVECNLPAQCPGMDSDCQKVTCAAHVCGLSFTAVGTPRAAQFQSPGDCHVVVCDGAGSSSVMPAIDDTDLPDDGNNCTKDLCTGGVVSHPFDASGTSCGVNGACTANGQCGCATDAGCLTPNTCGGGAPGVPFVCGCTPKTCNGVGKTCGVTATDGCFGTQNCNDFTKNGTETDVDCGGNGTCATLCGQGKQCNADTDCGTGHCADGVCCNQACAGTCLACSAAKKGSGADGICGSIASGLQDLNATLTCVGPKACDGFNNCKKIDGQICGLNGECVNGSCVDGVCCNTTCTGTCMACSAAAKGSGADGVCGKIAFNLPDSSPSCAGTSACDGNGLCKKTLGQACSVGSQCLNGLCSDSVCCGVASCPACQSCALGGGGTCGSIPAGMSDFTSPNTCSGTMICDGVGACKKVNGQTCGASGECVSGSCLDGVCCGSASCPTCQSCALSGNGTCSNIQAGNPDNVPANACPGMVGACDGAGTCKMVNGQLCASGSTCLSGNCFDNVCCNAACDASTTCYTCNGATPGVCSPVVSADDPDSCAAATKTCDSSGSCLLKSGEPCFSNGQCASAFCNGATMTCF